MPCFPYAIPSAPRGASWRPSTSRTDKRQPARKICRSAPFGTARTPGSWTRFLQQPATVGNLFFPAFACVYSTAVSGRQGLDRMLEKFLHLDRVSEMDVLDGEGYLHVTGP